MVAELSLALTPNSSIDRPVASCPQSCRELTSPDDSASPPSPVPWMRPDVRRGLPVGRPLQAREHGSCSLLLVGCDPEWLVGFFALAFALVLRDDTGDRGHGIAVVQRDETHALCVASGDT